MHNIKLNAIFEQLPGFIGWKDRHFNYLGCNQNLANVLKLSHPEKIIGLQDHDLNDHNDKSGQFHLENDQLAIAGRTIKAIHQSTSPYKGDLFYLIKKPLYDQQNQINGLIFTCHEFTHTTIIQLIAFDKKKWGTELSSTYYYLTLQHNPFKLSARELECLFYILRGKSAKLIAEILGLSKRTVEFYMVNIKNKFNCENKTELIYLAIANHYFSYVPPQVIDKGCF